MRLKIILFYIALITTELSSAQLYTFRNYNHRDGLYMASINCLEQTKDGYLWIGTDGGDLIRYDGDLFVEMREENGDNNHHFRHITSYGDSLLIASQYKGFFAFLPQENRYVKLHDKNVDVQEALACVRSGNYYYFVGRSGIVRSDLNGKRQKILTIENNDLQVNQIITLDNEVIILTNAGTYVASGTALKKLDKWLGLDLNEPDGFHFGYYNQGKLLLFNNRVDRWLEIVMNSRGGFFSINENETEFRLESSEQVISTSYNAHSNALGLLTNQGRVYTQKGNEIKLLAHNYNEPLEEAKQILSDMNGDFWISSRLRGIYKVSLEGFTKLQLLPLYQKPDIMFPYRTVYGDVIISTSNETYMRNLVENETNRTFNFTVHGAAEINGSYFFATNIGIKKYNPESSPDFETVFFENVKITMILADEHYLYAGVSGKGLYKINTKTNEIALVGKEKDHLPEYFYTAQFSPRKKQIYFGTNFGIYSYHKSSGKVTRLDLPYSKLGGYSGVSTKDIYGTCWFTLEKAIVGISDRDELLFIEGDKNFNTNIFYTLNSDNFGNLIVGTNKGISILKIDKNGAIIDNRHYDGRSGFDGYETHMRSQFQSEDGIFVGTIEGLFLINTRILENLKSPLAPVVISIEDQNINGSSYKNNFLFEFHVNNPKAGKITYSYRLRGVSEEWTSTENTRIPLYNLGNGSYELEVRSSYDGVHYSDSTIYPFNVQLPLYLSNWFVILVILLVVTVNIILLRYNKAFDTNNLLETKDTVVHLRMTPGIILFGTIAVSFAHITAPLLNDQLELHLGTSLAASFALLTIYFLSLSSKKSKQEYLYQRYLIIALSIIMTQFFYELYLSRLHAFHILGIVITSMVVPFILNKIRSTIIFSLLILALSVIMALIILEPVYPKSYFMIAIVVMVGLLIFTSYLRYDSIEKMMFISGIINKGNIPAVAFNNEGMITYASENISLFINAGHEEIIGKHITTLNNHIPFEGNYKEVDVLKDFKDGGNYLVPMLGKENQIKWVEWSYKVFSGNVKVILGQDVSEKMELENTYELLVQNAEDFIYRCDISANFIFLNDICFKKLGYNKEELVGKPSLMIVHEDYKEEVENYYKDHFSERRKNSYKEFPIRAKNGTIIWIGQHVTTLFAAASDSYINGYIALARDITQDREQQQLIREQRDNITASINYARRIQFNLLPHERLFASSFREHFIIFKPKDIVSGDFYWMHKAGNNSIIALADCTGHGVPGSFMTLLGINLLNSIVQEEGITDPGMILSEVDRRLIEILPRESKGSNMNDGMELTVCVFNEDSRQLSFGCAGSRFLIFHNGEFTMFKGDNKHIGDKAQPGFESYQTNFTEFESDDQLYLFTDGFQDQFGGPKDKKYSFRRFLELLETNHELPLFEQRELIEREFDDWIGNGEQTDDLTLISIVRNPV